MTDINEKEKESAGTLSPLPDEGLRGDGTPKWYVVHLSLIHI